MSNGNFVEALVAGDGSGESNSKISSRGDNMFEIYRKCNIAPHFDKIPFVRQGIGGLTNCPIDQECINFIREAAAGRRCISEFDTHHRTVVKIEVPRDFIENDEYTDSPVKWFFYYWRKHDVDKVHHDNGIRPFEAVDSAAVGIGREYLDSIATAPEAAMDDRGWDEERDGREPIEYL